MSGSINKVCLLGSVGQDPEIRSTQGGEQVATIRLATDERWKDREGQPQTRTTWHTVVVWNANLIPIIERYVKKGGRIYVEGSLQVRKWTDQQGAERYATEIVLQKFRGELLLLDGPREGASDRQAPAPQRQAPRPVASGGGAGRPMREDLDDSIPF